MTPDSRRTAPLLWGLLFLFVLRVAGQMLVAFAGVRWLSPMKEWYSGLIPYPYLLVSQWLIIVFLAKVCWDFTRGRGWFVSRVPGFGRGVLIFGYVYLGAMVLRYVRRMALVPEVRWFGRTIPIFFHWALASHVIVFGRFHSKREADG